MSQPKSQLSGYEAFWVDEDRIRASSIEAIVNWTNPLSHAPKRKIRDYVRDGLPLSFSSLQQYQRQMMTMLIEEAREGVRNNFPNSNISPLAVAFQSYSDVNVETESGRANKAGPNHQVVPLAFAPGGARVGVSPLLSCTFHYHFHNQCDWEKERMERYVAGAKTASKSDIGGSPPTHDDMNIPLYSASVPPPAPGRRSQNPVPHNLVLLSLDPNVLHGWVRPRDAASNSDARGKQTSRNTVSQRAKLQRTFVPGLGQSSATLSGFGDAMDATDAMDESDEDEDTAVPLESLLNVGKDRNTSTPQHPICVGLVKKVYSRDSNTSFEVIVHRKHINRAIALHYSKLRQLRGASAVPSPNSFTTAGVTIGDVNKKRDRDEFEYLGDEEDGVYTVILNAPEATTDSNMKDMESEEPIVVYSSSEDECEGLAGPARHPENGARRTSNGSSRSDRGIKPTGKPDFTEYFPTTASHANRSTHYGTSSYSMAAPQGQQDPRANDEPIPPTWYAWNLSNVITTLREAEAVSGVGALDPALLQTVLNPISMQSSAVDGVDALYDVVIAPSAPKAGILAESVSTTSTDDDTEKSKLLKPLYEKRGKARHLSNEFISLFLEHGFNQSQLAAITGILCSPLAASISLIQGPPGSGKTSTILGLINSLHLSAHTRFYDVLLGVESVRQRRELTSAEQQRESSVPGGKLGQKGAAVSTESNSGLDGNTITSMKAESKSNAKATEPATNASKDKNGGAHQNSGSTVMSNLLHAAGLTKANAGKSKQHLSGMVPLSVGPAAKSKGGVIPAAHSASKTGASARDAMFEDPILAPLPPEVANYVPGVLKTLLSGPLSISACMEIITQVFAHRPRLLLTAPSNIAVDNMLLKLIKDGLRSGTCKREFVSDPSPSELDRQRQEKSIVSAAALFASAITSTKNVTSIPGITKPLVESASDAASSSGATGGKTGGSNANAKEQQQRPGRYHFVLDKYRPVICRVGEGASVELKAMQGVHLETEVDRLLSCKQPFMVNWKAKLRMEQENILGFIKSRRDKIVAEKEAVEKKLPSTLVAQPSVSPDQAPGTHPHEGLYMATPATVAKALVRYSTPVVQAVEAYLHSKHYERIADAVLQYFACIGDPSQNQRALHASTKQTLRNLLLEASTIVFTTTSSSALGTVEAFAQDTGFAFETVIIDEAAQSVEPSTLIPLRYGAKNVVLVGDPAQLPATLLSAVVKRSGYGKSLFARLVENGYPCHFLSLQYRMHPRISYFPSHEFYNGKLRDAVNIARGERNNILHDQLCFQPLLFYNVLSQKGCQFGPISAIKQKHGLHFSGQQKDAAQTRGSEEGGGLSYYNEEESKMVVALIHALHQWKGIMPGFSNPSASEEQPDERRSARFTGTVGIITFYRGQVALLKEYLERHFVFHSADKLANEPRAPEKTFSTNAVNPNRIQLSFALDVNTVDGFQGQERDVIIVSCVRSLSRGSMSRLPFNTSMFRSYLRSAARQPQQHQHEEQEYTVRSAKGFFSMDLLREPQEKCTEEAKDNDGNSENDGSKKGETVPEDNVASASALEMSDAKQLASAHSNNMYGSEDTYNIDSRDMCYLPDNETNLPMGYSTLDTSFDDIYSVDASAQSQAKQASAMAAAKPKVAVPFLTSKPASLSLLAPAVSKQRTKLTPAMIPLLSGRGAEVKKEESQLQYVCFDSSVMYISGEDGEMDVDFEDGEIIEDPAILKRIRYRNETDNVGNLSAEEANAAGDGNAMQGDDDAEMQIVDDEDTMGALDGDGPPNQSIEDSMLEEDFYSVPPVQSNTPVISESPIPPEPALSASTAGTEAAAETDATMTTPLPTSSTSTASTLLSSKLGGRASQPPKIPFLFGRSNDLPGLGLPGALSASGLASTSDSPASVSDLEEASTAAIEGAQSQAQDQEREQEKPKVGFFLRKVRHNVKSMLRNNNQSPNQVLGFIDDAMRINVALTRAKYACWVVGDGDVLTVSKYWMHFLEHCMDTYSTVNVKTVSTLPTSEFASDLLSLSRKE